MEERMVKKRTLTDAYHRALSELYYNGDFAPCNDWVCDQLELAMTMVVKEPMAEPKISKLIPCGPKELQQYVMEITDGILDFEVDKGNWHYTYHKRMVSNQGVNQIDFVIDELKRNPSSRRAVIVTRDIFEDVESENPACLNHIQYFIRNGRLDCTVLFRSNDALKAAFMNAFALIELQKKIADAVGVGVGTYTHRANSFHCYSRDLVLLEAFIARLENKEELTYNYKDGWDGLMELEIPGILESVEVLKGE